MGATPATDHVLSKVITSYGVHLRLSTPKKQKIVHFTGFVHRVEYLAAAGADTQAFMTARVALIEQALADAEAEALVNG